MCAQHRPSVGKFLGLRLRHTNGAFENNLATRMIVVHVINADREIPDNVLARELCAV